MAAITTAIVATVSAITISQIATAAVIVGAALSIAGAVTNNSTLKYVGMGIGIAGGLTSLAGAFGLFDPSMSLGGLFSGSDVAASSAAANAAAGAPAAMPPGGTIYSDPIGPTLAGDPLASGVVNAAAPLGPGMDAAAQAAGNAQEQLGAAQVRGTLDNLSANRLAAGIEPGSPFVPAEPGAGAAFAPPGTPPVPTAPITPAAPVPGAAPSAAGVGVTATQAGGEVAKGIMDGGQYTKEAMDLGQGSATFADKAKRAFDSLSPAVQYGLVAGTITAGAGMLSGMFQSMSASERLEFDKYVQDQRNQIMTGQLNLERDKFARATSTPGVISFGRR